jgi:hypothetical protein
MPAVSVNQQQLMGMAYSLKKGTMKRSEASKEVKDLADNMTLDQLKDFAATKHKGLPQDVDESGLTGFLSAGPFPRYNSYASNAGAGYISTERDKRDPLIQRFMDFIEGKEENKEEKANETIVAMAPPGVAAPQNTPGMGNVTPPSSGNVGSGDKFSDEDDEDIKKRVGIMSYEDYKKWFKKWQKQNQQN